MSECGGLGEVLVVIKHFGTDSIGGHSCDNAYNSSGMV